MAQTTNQVPLACGKVEIAEDCATWTNISGETQSISGTEQSIMIGDAYTLEGETALTGAGKREPLDLVVTIIYTEADLEAYEIARKIFEASDCGNTICIRYSPRGGDAGEEQLTSIQGVLSSFTYPAIDASAGGVVMGSFTVHTPGLNTTIVAS